MYKKKSILFVCLFLVILILVLSLLYFHCGITEDVTYVTSNKCRECHVSQYNSWHENTLHPYMFLPVSSPHAKILGDFDSNNPVVTFKKEEIEFVIGNKWEQVYARTIDGERYLFPAKWYIIEKRWVPYKVKDWQETPISYECNGCHTTGFDPNTLKFAEFGIGCEACHGPGSKHVQHASLEHKQLCKLCHRDKWQSLEVSEDYYIVRSTSPSVCGQCHNREFSSTGDKIIKGSNFYFTADFEPSDDLTTANFISPTPVRDKKEKDWWGNGLSKNHNQKFSNWSKSAHSKSLNRLLENHTDTKKEYGEPTDECLQCHSTDYRSAAKQNKPDMYTARFGVTCVACHAPHGSANTTERSNAWTISCTECHQKLMHSTTQQHIPCSDPVASCADCHMPRIVKAGGFFSIRSHTFQIIRPQASKGAPMPNSCQNGGCHADQNIEWAVKAYNDFYGNGL